MTLRSIVLGGTAAAALICGSFVAPCFAQTAPDQSAPAAQAAPATPDATTDNSSMTKDTGATKVKHHARRHHRMRSARAGGRYSSPSERAETLRLNQEQLAKARGASEGQYGTMQQQQPAPAPSDMNAPQAPSAPSLPGKPLENMENKATAPLQNNPPPANTPQPQNPSQPPQ